MLNIQKKVDKYSSTGTLSIHSKKVEIPRIIPTSNELASLKLSPKVKSNHLTLFSDLCVHTEYFDRKRLDKLQTDDGYEEILKEISVFLKSLPVKKKILHFEFYSEVDKLSDAELLLLLELPLELNLPVAEIPNGYNFDTSTLKKRIELSKAWQHNASSEIALMGVAAKAKDIDVLEKMSNYIDCFGIVLNYLRSSKPLLYKVWDKLKYKGKWIHAFMTPRSYRDLHHRGSLGPLINFYGVDTFSSYQADRKRNYRFLKWKFMQSEEKKERMALKNTKYFVLTDYSTPRIQQLLKK